MVRNIYQLWQDRQTGLYYGVKRSAGGEVLGMTAGLVTCPTAWKLPTLQFFPVTEPPKLSNPRWRMLRLSVS